MSDSYIKRPYIHQACSISERWYKRYRAHLERMRLRAKLAHGDYDTVTSELAPWNEWVTDRDGKLYFPEYLMKKRDHRISRIAYRHPS